MRGYYRHTKIIVTLGPSTESTDQIKRLIVSGVDMIRLNMAYASIDWVTDAVVRIREASREVERHVAVIMDLKGPEIRTGTPATDIVLEPGQFFALYTQDPPAGTHGIDVNYAGLPGDVEIGALVLVDNGAIRLQVTEKDDSHVLCRVLKGGKLGPGRLINLPGSQVRMPALTDKDRADLAAGVRAGIDFAALSFVRQPDDLVELRTLLKELGSPARVIAKIEDQSGLRNLEGIIELADGIMAVRGDLGIEIESHILPLVQDRIVESCFAHGKPVIIATHLLESMFHSPMPTRQEITGVTVAVGHMVDALMLSGETAAGRYPHECVTVLQKITESVEPSGTKRLNEAMELRTPKTKMLRSAAVLAQDLGNSGIVVFTRSGALPYTLGALRAQGVPIYAFTDVEALFRQLLLPWGVEPFLIEFSDDPEVTIKNALANLKRRHWCEVGTWLVVITNALAHGAIVDTIQVRQVE